jgi:hypothetical protein
MAIFCLHCQGPLNSQNLPRLHINALRLRVLTLPLQMLEDNFGDLFTNPWSKC